MKTLWMVLKGRSPQCERRTLDFSRSSATSSERRDDRLALLQPQAEPELGGDMTDRELLEGLDERKALIVHLSLAISAFLSAARGHG
jgi:hypothetical protein